MKTVLKTLSKQSFITIFLIVGLFIGDGLSQEIYPNKPVTVVCTFGAGGTIDNFTRIICRIAEKGLGQPIIVENKPGGTSSIGMGYVIRSKPDGYTLGSTSSSAYVSAPHMRKLPYDIFTDVVDIATFLQYTFGIAVRTDAPWNTWEDVIAYARKNPQKFTYSTAGVGNIPHIVMERIAIKEGIKWTMIPFKSSGECVAATLGGHADAVVMSGADFLPYVQAGKLKVLLSFNNFRWPEVPNVPHIREKGYDFHGWAVFVIFGPKGLPEPVRQKIEDVFGRAKKDPSYLKALKDAGLYESDMTGKEHSKFWRSEYEEMGKVIKALGLAEK